MQSKHLLFFLFFSLSLARDALSFTGDCARISVCFVCRWSDGASRRETDTEKRSMFPQQMGIIRAVQVYAHNRSQCTLRVFM